MPHETPAPTFITRIEVAPGEPSTIPATHVEYDAASGYRVALGIGRQASTAGAAR